MLFKKAFEKNVDGTGRAEAFSDSIFAFSLTLLALDLNFGKLAELSNQAVWDVLMDSGPKFITFLISFFVIAILWVNHHHFFNNFNKTNWKVLWHNNIFLLWIILMPFITNFLGNNPTQPLVISIYGLVMAAAVGSFLLMVNYVFFRSDLVDAKISIKTRKRELRRGLPGLSAYLLAALISQWNVYISLVLFVLIPILYFVPTFLVADDGE